ncbi:MAG: pyruvate kinase [Flavobacteriales bacterium]|nr:pyruvate kinase [Flavobacteriales bacterium]
MKYLDNKTKIVSTMGPACADKKILKEMIENGVNVCRINFSHGSYEDHQIVIDNIREINRELNIHTGILADLQGPKIRTGLMKGNGFLLKENATIEIGIKDIEGDENQISINYQDFPKDVSAGEFVLVDDGKIKLQILETNNVDRVKAKVIHGGLLTSRKGVNLPNTAISLPCLTPKDLQDLDFALKNDIAWIGLSFVRSAADVIELKKLIKSKKKSSLVIAKIEKPEALKNIGEIIEAADGLMVARGDLGVEIPLQDVPLVQKSLVKKCRNMAKPVIIATQMMESMIEQFSPTRAEVNDVANAVLDGADAVMLSGETSVGKFPVEVIKTIFKIIARVELYDGLYNTEIMPVAYDERKITDAICDSAARLVKATEAKGIVTMTFSGYTAFKASSYRPKAFIFVYTANFKILDMLSLIWGVKGFYYDKFVSTDHTIDDIKFLLKKDGYTQTGDYVVHIASMPIAKKGTSNMLRISHIK